LVLHPKFLAEVFATVITFRQRFSKDGVLKKISLYQHIWSGYSESIKDLLLEVLQDFELILPLRNDQDTLLIPSFLPPDMPSLVPWDVV
jgi:hypothetical protein